MNRAPFVAWASRPCIFLFILTGCAAPSRHLPTPAQVIESKRDLWGEAALAQPGGPSYAFFEKLLPPLRYVDSDFHHYPILLSAPGSPTKGRLLSNGSQINALARQPNWANEIGIPIHIFVGQKRQPFGTDQNKLTGPKLAHGWIP